MKSIIQNNSIFIALFLLGWIALMVLNLLYDKVDILLVIGRYQNEFLNQLFFISTRFGEAIAFLGFAFLYLFLRLRVSAAIAISGVFVLIVSGLLKAIFRFERPFLYFKNLGIENLYPKIEGVDPYIGLTSFPSGHAMGAFTLLALISFYVSSRPIKVLLFLTACMVALSRMYLGHHFLEDVLFGSLVGLLISLVIYYWIGNWKFPRLDYKFVLEDKRFKLKP